MEGGAAAATAKVEHITKASSVELLSKFAQVSSKSNNNKLALPLVKKKNKNLRLSTKRQKINREKPDGTNYESLLNNCAADRKSLLAPAANRKSTASIRLAKARNLKNKSLLGSLQKTWRKTVEGASKIFIERHYNRHKRLISDLA
ncbi:hypothetical protein DCAR_0417482 [Daucus carota subsp. sativus]|uniref:Uncharacterized protein n=1 Tax=Daucus carota subsp. sativus TaxID=79200 RepID=A0AAF0WZZ6_DAUCS|nr:PREDICTED: uncharacterized protein LOC108218061 [Daucus carota subsp. sativus]WOG98141.1 hypothetical protein DCAR_0417482 [Daucus carota subsp. sativus]